MGYREGCRKSSNRVDADGLVGWCVNYIIFVLFYVALITPQVCFVGELGVFFVHSCECNMAFCKKRMAYFAISSNCRIDRINVNMTVQVSLMNLVLCILCIQ